MRFASTACDTPGLAVKATPSTRPGDASTAWAVASVKSTDVAPAAESASPNFTMPEMVYVCGWPVVRTLARSPTLYPAVSAEFLSMTISSAALGACPSATEYGLSSATRTQFEPSKGTWAASPIGLPCLSTIWA